MYYKAKVGVEPSLDTLEYVLITDSKYGHCYCRTNEYIIYFTIMLVLVCVLSFVLISILIYLTVK